MALPTIDTACWSQNAATPMIALKSGPDGLCAAIAATKLATNGRKTMGETKHVNDLRRRRFERPLVLILIFAAVIWLVLQQWVDATIILLAVFGSAAFSFTQKHRTFAAVEGLKRRLALTCRVLRSGAEKIAPVDQIVPGDVVLLSAANLIPADGLVIGAEDFLVAQSAMTGKPFPVEKPPGVADADAPTAARANAVFIGASVQSGWRGF